MTRLVRGTACFGRPGIRCASTPTTVSGSNRKRFDVLFNLFVFAFCNVVFVFIFRLLFRGQHLNFELAVQARVMAVCCTSTVRRSYFLHCKSKALFVFDVSNS